MFRLPTLAFCLLAIAAPAQAELEKLTLRHLNLQPTTSGAARRTLQRIDEAALTVCGASSFSLTEVKIATRTSSCWQEAAGNVVRQSGNVLLAQAFARFPAASR